MAAFVEEAEDEESEDAELEDEEEQEDEEKQRASGPSAVCNLSFVCAATRLDHLDVLAATGQWAVAFLGTVARTLPCPTYE